MVSEVGAEENILIWQGRKSKRSSTKLYNTNLYNLYSSPIIGVNKLSGFFKIPT